MYSYVTSAEATPTITNICLKGWPWVDDGTRTIYARPKEWIYETITWDDIGNSLAIGTIGATVGGYTHYAITSRETKDGTISLYYSDSFSKTGFYWDLTFNPTTSKSSKFVTETSTTYAYEVSWQTTTEETRTLYGSLTETTLTGVNYPTCGTTVVSTYSSGIFSGTNSKTKKIITTTTKLAESYGVTQESFLTGEYIVTNTTLTWVSTSSNKSIDLHTVYKWESSDTGTLRPTVYIFTETKIGKTAEYSDLFTSYTADFTLTSRPGIITQEKESYDYTSYTKLSKTGGGRIWTSSYAVHFKTSTIVSTTTPNYSASSYPGETTTVNIVITETEQVEEYYWSIEADLWQTITITDPNALGPEMMSETYSFFTYTSTTKNQLGLTNPILGPLTTFREYAEKLVFSSIIVNHSNYPANYLYGSTKNFGNFTRRVSYYCFEPWLQYYYKRLSGEAAAGAGSETSNFGIYTSVNISGSHCPLGVPGYYVLPYGQVFVVDGIKAVSPINNPHVLFSIENDSSTTNAIYADGANITFVTASKNSFTGTSFSSSANIEKVDSALTYYGNHYYGNEQNINVMQISINYPVYKSGQGNDNKYLAQPWLRVTQSYIGDKSVITPSNNFLNSKETIFCGGFFATNVGPEKQTTFYKFTEITKGSNLSFFKKTCHYTVW